VESPTERVNLTYVEIPVRPYLTLKSSRKLDSDDLGGFGAENDKSEEYQELISSDR
jgi:hypothetical protein